MRRNVLLALSIGVGVVMVTLVSARAAPQQQPKSENQTAEKIDLDQLENAPGKFLGKRVTVEGEVDKVLGPHLFTIDERDWVDAEREMPVVVPEPFAAIVRTDVPVRVTGTIQKVPIAQIERERGILSDKIRAEIEAQPVLVASEVTAIQSGVTLRVRADQPVGTGGAGATAPLTDTNQVAQAQDKNLVGRRVDLKNVTVAAANDRGFWIRTPSGERIFVMPSTKASVKEGQNAAVQGVVLELPEGLRVQINAGDEPVYIYADRVTGS